MSNIHPVILCGGSGTRLWPASRAGRPKQFIALIGERSSFQNTVLRVGQIAGAGAPIVIAGVGHRRAIEAQLAQIGAEAVLILEPEARDSAPAMAAAAAHIAAEDPDGVAVFVSADHHMPDAAAFAAAVGRAVEGAKAGSIVTLGLKPDAPATAFGYIRPGGAEGPVRPVAAFVEKPDAATARRYMDEGYLWNTGNFIVRAATLIEELEAHAPAVAAAAAAALKGAVRAGGALVLGEAFAAAPKISIDYAVMEKTARAAVAPSSFAWMDIGAWDAVHRAMAADEDGNAGEALFIEASGNLVRAPADADVALVGVSGLAVVVEDGAVLVAALGKAQRVKMAGEVFRIPRASGRFGSLEEARGWFDRWMGTAVLPMWATLGLDPAHGGFREVLLFGADEPARRARVQPRQAWSFAMAGKKGWPGPWKAAVAGGLDAFDRVYRREDGLFRTLATADGTVVDDAARLYDQAFALLAWSATGDEDKALGLLDVLESWRHPAGGWKETGEHPFQANAHMHLFEAALAWEAAGGDGRWSDMADQIAELALDRFIDAEGGFVREVFDADWAPAAGEDGRMLEPGHQFEWAHLLLEWSTRRERIDAAEAAERLYEAGLSGVDHTRGVVVDGLWEGLVVRKATARLWPQTEWLKAALAFGREDDALAAMNALYRYVHRDVRGVWFDVMTPEGELVPQAPPASTLYHIVGVWLALCGDGPVG